MKGIVIYCAHPSQRLNYVLDWLFAEQFGLSYTIAYKLEDVAQHKFCIYYGGQGDNGISIPVNGLLYQTDINEHAIDIGRWNEVPTLYADLAGKKTLPFDIFSAIFFLLSRYEEYFMFIPDKHNRYPATESILYKNGWLRRPLVDEWVEQFRLLLNQHGLNIEPCTFKFKPTYDIDIAWSYKHKGALRNIGAGLKDVVKGNFKQLSDRVSVLMGKAHDPYDSFDWLADVHASLNLKPTYFILSAATATQFDKNIPLTNNAMQVLIKRLFKNAYVGIHPSYNTDKDDDLLVAELRSLEGIVGANIHQSRQHYIRLSLPSTCHQLIAASITDDYSIGYGTHLGFRAGTGKSFHWFSLLKNEISTLRMHPFCFMDTTAHYNEGLSATDAFAVLEEMSASIKANRSSLTTIFHNFSLGTAEEWSGWRKEYAAFLNAIVATS